MNKFFNHENSLLGIGQNGLYLENSKLVFGFELPQNAEYDQHLPLKFLCRESTILWKTYFLEVVYYPCERPLCSIPLSAPPHSYYQPPPVNVGDYFDAKENITHQILERVGGLVIKR